MKNNQTIYGSLFLIIAVLSHGLYGVFSRMIGVEFGQVFQVIARSTLLLIFFTVAIITQKSWKRIAKKDYVWYLLMIFPGLIALISMFIAFNHLTLGTVLFIYYAVSTFGSYLLGYAMFREKLTLVKIISLIFCFFGLYMIFSGSIKLGNSNYLLLACIAGLGAAAWNTVSKKISHKYPVAQILVIDNLLMVLVGFPISILLQEKISLPSLTLPWLGVLGYSIAAIGSSIFTIKGFRYLQAQVGSLLLLLEPIFGAFIGFLLYKENMNISFAIGAFFILVGAALPNAIRLHREV